MSKKVIAIPKKDKEKLEHKKLKVAVYARVSTDYEEQQSSIETQKSILKNL